MARIPSTESTQKMSNMPAISLKGLGRIFIIIPTANNISTSHRVIDLPLTVKRVI